MNIQLRDHVNEFRIFGQSYPLWSTDLLASGQHLMIQSTGGFWGWCDEEV